MPPFTLRIWRFLERWPRSYFSLALALETLAAWVIGRKSPVDVQLTQFVLGAQEILLSHRIHSTFLPVGYAALLGYAELLGRRWGAAGEEAAIFLLGILLLVAIFLLSRAVLRLVGSPTFATTGALIVGLTPALIYNVKRINDTDLTVVVLLGILLTAVDLHRRPAMAPAVLAGVALGCALLVRPNLAVMALLLGWSLWRLPLGRWLPLAAVAGATMALVYGAGTAAVHGTPFLPKNGPYNLYAGYNDHSAAALERYMNAEQSIMPAMREHGLHADLDWKRPSDLPGVDDVRDERHIPFYDREAKAFMRQHPGESLALVGVKTATFFRPIYDNLDNKSGLFHIFRLTLKVLMVVLTAVWALLLVYSGLTGRRWGSTPVILMVVLYVLPFVLINADPRFRVAMEALVTLDLIRMAHVALRRTEAQPVTEMEEQEQALAA